MEDLDSFDPDWEFAQVHGKASRIGYIPKTGQRKICPCCFHYIEKTPIPYCQHTKELEVIGFGIPLFYVFIKQCLILLLLSICTYNILSLYKAVTYNHDFCHPQENTHRLLASSVECTSFMVEMARIEDDLQQLQIILRIGAFLIHLLFLIYTKDTITKLRSYYDERTCTLSDYSLKLKEIPLQKGIKSKLRAFFNQRFQNKHEVKQITLLPEYKEIESLQKQKHELIQKIRPFYKDYQTRNENQQQLQTLERELKKIKREIQEQAEKLYEAADKDELECESAIIILNTDAQKEEVLKEYEKCTRKQWLNAKYFGQGSQILVVEEAPEPNQIIWENMNLKKKDRVIRKLAGWLLSLLVLVVVTIAFFFIMIEKSSILEEAFKHYHSDPVRYQSQRDGAVALVYIMLFLVVLFNKLGMVILFHKFTDLQCHKTSSSFQFSFGLKYCLGLFFTTALMTLAVEAFYLNNYYSHPYGLIEEETVMYFLNALFVPLFWVVNPFLIKKYIMRKLKLGRKDLTQREANELMEQYGYDIGKRYAQIIQTMWFTFLYATMLPIGAFLSLGGITLYYWIDKYNFLRRSTLNVKVQGKLTNLALKLLDLTLLFRVLGQILFDLQVRDQYHPQSVVFTCIAFIYVILPMNTILHFINGQKFYLQQKTYDDVKDTFIQTYHTLHPTYYPANKEKLNKKILRSGVTFFPIVAETLKEIQIVDDVI